MEIKEIIVKLLNNENITGCPIFPNRILTNDISEIPTELLTDFLANYINFISTNNLEYLDKFILENEAITVKKTFKEFKRQIINLIRVRELKIQIYQLKKEFLMIKIDLTDRKYIINLINYFYLESIDFLKLKSEISIKKNNLFLMRNKPTMSLKEFSDKLMKEKPESMEEIKVVSLKDIREMDEFKDEIRTKKGNRANKG